MPLQGKLNAKMICLEQGGEPCKERCPASKRDEELSHQDESHRHDLLEPVFSSFDWLMLWANSL